jgi:hypothetical protein
VRTKRNPTPSAVGHPGRTALGTDRQHVPEGTNVTNNGFELQILSMLRKIEAMIFTSPHYKLTIETFSVLAPDFSKNTCQYNKKYELQDPRFRPSIGYGLTCHPGNETCMVLAGGGGGALTTQSIIICDSICWLAIGDQVVCFGLPTLEMNWHRKCDDTTCFEIFLSPDEEGLVVHGELEVSKISFGGDCIWSVSGKDIFTGGFWVHQNHIEAIDFNEEKYSINLKTGSITLIE